MKKIRLQLCSYIYRNTIVDPYFYVNMEDHIIRMLQVAGGPRSTAEISKSIKMPKEGTTETCKKLANCGQIVQITDSMWCFNPKFRKSPGN